MMMAIERRVPITDKIRPVLAVFERLMSPLESSAKVMPSAPQIMVVPPKKKGKREMIPSIREAVARAGFLLESV